MCAVVSIRCSECDEVKPKEEVEIRSNGDVCHDCKRPENVAHAEEEATTEEEEVQDPDESNGGEAESEADDGDDEEQEVTPDDFDAQDALSW